MVHVLSPFVPFGGEEYSSPKVYQELEARSRAQAQKDLNVLVAKAKKAGTRAKSLLTEGIPHREEGVG